MTTTTWLLTWTCYGTWLPGDDRGFVSRVRDRRPDDPASTARHEHDALGREYDSAFRGLWADARSRLKCDPVHLDAEQGRAVLAQFRETAAFRGWGLFAAAVMHNHVHLLVGALGEVDPDVLLRDFKGYASRSLNRRWGKPASGTWWTEGGSKRKKATSDAVTAAVGYVRTQPNPLVVWVADEWL